MTTLVYSRLPRPSGIELTREQLRVYMMCNGQRVLNEVAQLTRLTAADLLRTVQELQQMNLLAQAPAAVAEALPEQDVQVQSEPVPVVEAPRVGPGADALALLSRLEEMLGSRLGDRAAPLVAQLRACPDSASLQLLVPRLVAKIKLTIDRETGDALNREFQQAFPA